MAITPLVSLTNHEANSQRLGPGIYLATALVIDSILYLGTDSRQMAEIKLQAGERMFITVHRAVFINQGGDVTVTQLPDGVTISTGGYGPAGGPGPGPGRDAPDFPMIG